MEGEMAASEPVQDLRNRSPLAQSPARSAGPADVAIAVNRLAISPGRK